MTLEIRALFGDDYCPRSEVGYWLLQCRYTRALRSWSRPYCYGWLRMTDQLKAQQRKLLEFRPH